jgi:hypothetical protein
LRSFGGSFFVTIGRSPSLVFFGLLFVSVAVEDDTDDRSTSADPDSEHEATAVGIDCELLLDELPELLTTVWLLFPPDVSADDFIVVDEFDVDEVPTSLSIRFTISIVNWH